MAGKLSFDQKHLDIGFLVTKVVTSIRYGWDTYHAAVGEIRLEGLRLVRPESYTITPQSVVTGVLDVLVIDIAFLGVWMVAAYSGSSERLKAMRPFAAALAWAMYFLMLPIAILNGGLVALIARVIGGGLLLYDTLDIVVAWRRSLRREAATTTLEEKLAAARSKVLLGAYRAMLRLETLFTALPEARKQAKADLRAELAVLSKRVTNDTSHRLKEVTQAAVAEAAERETIEEAGKTLGVLTSSEIGITFECAACGGPGGPYGDRPKALKYLRNHWGQKHKGTAGAAPKKRSAKGRKVTGRAGVSASKKGSPSNGHRELPIPN